MLKIISVRMFKHYKLAPFISHSDFTLVKKENFDIETVVEK